MPKNISYVPILRWKRAEKIALEELHLNDKNVIRPFIELVPQNFENGKGSENIAKDIKKCWGNSSFYIDPRYLNDSINCETLFSTLALEGLSPIPVSSLDRSPLYQKSIGSILALGKKKVCFRIKPEETSKSDFHDRLNSLLAILNIKPNQTHILLDYEVYTGLQPKINDVLASLRYLDNWSRIIISGSSFPQDLRDLKKNERHNLARSEWLSWKHHLLSQKTRATIFSDYTVQYGKFKTLEGFPMYSASIRYTHQDYWVVMRGESVFKDDGPGFAQWPAIAQLVCECEEFCGRDYSYGDNYIHKMSLQAEKSGSAETWIRAGINHHIAFAARQTSSLLSTLSTS
jgi:hypothetical protein